MKFEHFEMFTKRLKTIWPHLSFTNKSNIKIPQSLKSSNIKKGKIVLQHYQNKHVILPNGAQTTLVSSRAGGYVLEGRKIKMVLLLCQRDISCFIRLFSRRDFFYNNLFLLWSKIHQSRNIYGVWGKFCEFYLDLNVHLEKK